MSPPDTTGPEPRGCAGDGVRGRNRGAGFGDTLYADHTADDAMATVGEQAGDVITG